MPIDLNVTVTRYVDVASLLQDAQQTLAELDPARRPLAIAAYEYRAGSLAPLRVNQIGGPESPRIALQIAGQPETVVAACHWTLGCAQVRTVVSFSVVTRTPLGFALAAAAAIALARAEATDIVDQAGVFVPDVRLSAQQFFNRIRVAHASA